jgi:CDGSH-type Zn-finger protein
LSDTRGPRIRVTKNGPYILEGPVPLARQSIEVDDAGESVAWKVGEPFPPRQPRALCRCGMSGVKPNCDGSHLAMGFDGTETASNAPYAEAATTIEGPTLLLRDRPELCAEARFCSAKGTAWHRVEREDEESRDVVVEEARMCPSGRYTAVDKATGEALEPELEPSIGLVEDPSQGVSGPIWVRGGIPVESADGTVYEVRNRVTLCRCGASKNKPFCDATHVEIGFSAAD